MRPANWTGALGLAFVLAVGPAIAQERGTPDEAKALVEKAAVHFKDVGADKAMTDFADPKGGYMDRDLFVFVYSADGKILSAPGIPMLVGRDATTLKDADGKEFGKLIITAAKGGGGWAEYRMTNPVTKKADNKKTYALQVGDYVLGAGAYTQ
ncbi:MAG: cache domain-containing protein [Xanthobacteraceae bacterium]|jgi:signal transduction histidine kinase